MKLKYTGTLPTPKIVFNNVANIYILNEREDFVLQPNEEIIVNTKITIETNKDLYKLVMLKAYGIDVLLVDNDNEIKVVVKNINNVTRSIRKGEYLCNIVFIPEMR